MTVVAAGRTDTGVHATQQVVSFRTNATRPEKAWVLGTNANLPSAVRVRWAREVPHAFHARFSALSRRYLYLLYEGDADPLATGRVHAVPSLDDARMQRAADLLKGEQDFSTFRASGCQSLTPMRYLHEARIHRWGDLVGVNVQANAFLLRMMRNLTGALVDVGRGHWSVEDFAQALAARDRNAMGKTAPAHGLYLVEVGYPSGAGLNFPAGEPPPLLAAYGRLDRL